MQEDSCLKKGRDKGELCTATCFFSSSIRHLYVFGIVRGELRACSIAMLNRNDAFYSSRICSLRSGRNGKKLDIAVYVAQTEFPSSYENFPIIATDATLDPPGFRSMKTYSSGELDDDTPVLGRILPIVDTVEWVERLAQIPGVTDIQLRIKDETEPDRIADRASTCQKICQENGVRLWINDHWEAAIKAGCFGVHVGQEDLVKCMNAGGLEQLRAKNMALGISTHAYGELSAALGVKPSYISLGPVFATSSKKVQFDPQGLGIVSRWKQLIPPSIPFVTIGGISDLEAAKQNRKAGADCIAVIGAVTTADDVAKTVADLNEVMQ
jgi:thiamine-phosphate diphosphorylase